MARILFAAVLLFISYGVAQVVELDDTNFDTYVDGSRAVFVEFYAPWCGHCKKLSPDYDVVGEAFSKEKGVVVAKIDADKYKDIGGRFDVHGFPTLKFFPKGSTEPVAYEGGRSIDDLVTYINNKAGTNARVKKAASNVVELTSANFDKIVLDSSKDVLVEFYAPWCGHCKTLIPVYEKLANVYATESDIVIAKIDADGQKDIGGRYGVSGFPTLKWFGKNDKTSPLAYESGRDLPAFVEYINEKTGSQRNEDGTLKETAGRVSALDAIVGGFSSGDHASIITKIEEAVKSLTGTDATFGALYVKLANVIKEKGAEFINTETQRIERMIAGAGVAAKKVDELILRKNILKAFA